MTAGPPAEERQQKDRPTSDARQGNSPRGHLNDSPRFNMTHKVIGTIAAMLGAVVAVIAIINFVMNGFPGSAQGARTESSTTTPTAAGAISPSDASASRDQPSPTSNSLGLLPSAPAPLGAGTCLGSEAQITPCNGPHKYEVVNTKNDDCLNAALKYSGADPDLDVTYLESVSGPVGSNSFTCALALADGAFEHSMDGALSSSTGDEYRRCVMQTTVDHELPCDEAHTMEYFTLPHGTAPDQATCDEAADRYLGVIHQRFADLLKIVPLAYSDLNDDHPRCAVQVRGNDVLTASVRAIGTKALPLQPAG